MAAPPSSKVQGHPSSNIGDNRVGDTSDTTRVGDISDTGRAPVQSEASLCLANVMYNACSPFQGGQALCMIFVTHKLAGDHEPGQDQHSRPATSATPAA